MSNTTERYIRRQGQWVKITRNQSARNFTLARGWCGDVKAHDIKTYSFKHLRTWAEAESLASQHIENHA